MSSASQADVGLSVPKPRVKPKLRGVSHVLATIAAIPAVVMLVTRASEGVATSSAIVYGLSLILLLGVSAFYHAPMWSPGIRAHLRRLDHSSIYLLIAGSYTPICLLVLEPSVGVPLLWIAWAAALLGILKSLLWWNAPRALSAGIYIVVGLIVLPWMKVVYSAIGLIGTVLLFGGGILYCTGAIIYVKRWPDPFPTAFGYHEIFHVFVIGAAACHYAAFWRVLAP